MLYQVYNKKNQCESTWCYFSGFFEVLLPRWVPGGWPSGSARYVARGCKFIYFVNKKKGRSQLHLRGECQKLNADLLEFARNITFL